MTHNNGLRLFRRTRCNPFIMTKSHLLALALAVFSCSATAFDAPETGALLIEEDFSTSELPAKWSVQTGSWSISDGALTGSEIADEKHAAAARRVIETGDAIYQFKFRLTEGSKAFHFGFDPVRGALDKKGHLFSVIVSPTSWKILKHVDKNKPKEDPNEVLASAEATFTPGEWYHLRLETKGNGVAAAIKGIESLTATHPTFGVKKPTLVFRASGEAVEIDELRVWEMTD